MSEPRRQAAAANAAPLPLLFAVGEPRDVAGLLAQGPDRIPTLTRPLATALQAELAPMAGAAAARSAAAVTAFVAAVDRLFPADAPALAETLLVLLALDGLVAPAARRLVYGPTAPASITAVTAGSEDGAMPFLRACVRPSTQAPAAVFLCGEGFPHAAHLHGLLSEHSVRITVGSLADDRSLVVDGQAQRPLLRIGALVVTKSVAEYTARSTLPQVSPNITALHDVSLALAKAVLIPPEGPSAFAAAVAEAAADALPMFEPAAALAAALGVLNHGLAGQWHRHGVLPLPPAYHLAVDDGYVSSQRLVTWV